MNCFDKNTQKELKAQYKVLLADVWKDERMIDYCTKKADVVIKFDNGFFAEIEKEGIKKNFCFGYSRYDSDYDSAEEMSNFAKSDIDYFRNENLKGLNEIIEFYSDTSNKLYFTNHYTNQKNNTLKIIQSFDECTPVDIDNTEKYQRLSENDRKLLIEALNKELEFFTKRLDTYLKKYGLSKVRLWSYWQDA